MQIKNRRFSKSLLIVLTAVCVIGVANLYYDQVLLIDIARYFSVSIATFGLIVTAIQIGYTLGLFPHIHQPKHGALELVIY